jgi:hypothetical protein
MTAIMDGNGTIRTPPPPELFGEDWLEWIESRHGCTQGQA